MDVIKNKKSPVFQVILIAGIIIIIGAFYFSGLGGSRPIFTADGLSEFQQAEILTAAQNNSDGNKNSGCKIKGNINSKGEKIYHLIGCGSYDKTAIEENKGERTFCSEEEAFAAGWRKAKNCP